VFEKILRIHFSFSFCCFSAGHSRNLLKLLKLLKESRRRRRVKLPLLPKRRGMARKKK
jgi:hypothetical protein